jgi:hypothetical protein
MRRIKSVTNSRRSHTIRRFKKLRLISWRLGLGFIGVRLAQASPDQVQIDEIQRQKHKITKRTHLIK